MKHMKAAEFKAKCLRVMAEVEATGEEVIVTKRGKPIARVLPMEPVVPAPNYFGWAHGTIDVIGDVLAPVDTAGWTFDGEPWDETYPDPDFAPPTVAPLLSDGARWDG